MTQIPSDNPPNLMTIKQACAFLKISRSTFHEMRKSRKIPTVWVTGRRPRFLESDLIAIVLLVRKGGRRNDV